MGIIIDDELVEFDWDKGNSEKNWIKHQVTIQEAEEAFADGNKIAFLDVKHLGQEERFFLLGKTFINRLLAIVYTRRDERVRVISVRDANKKEVKIYEEAISSTKIQK